MSSVQSPEELGSLLRDRLVGQSIRQLQVLAINGLKSVVPSLDALVGALVVDARCDARSITICTSGLRLDIDLQRTGRVSWLPQADTWSFSMVAAHPSARLLLEDGSGFDFSEPAKTKRISVTLSRSSVEL